MFFLLLVGHLIICSSGYEFSKLENPKVSPLRFLELKRADRMKRQNDFNALNDYRGSSHHESDTSYRDALFENERNRFDDFRKKSDRPKYDPGWKFIGLGKRPEFEDEFFAPDLRDSREGVNPLLGISTLINFEFFNAIKDEIDDVAKQNVKKEHSIGASSGFSNDDSGSLRYNNKMNWFSGRQKSMYDPAWMLTGLGK